MCRLHELDYYETHPTLCISTSVAGCACCFKFTDIIYFKVLCPWLQVCLELDPWPIFMKSRAAPLTIKYMFSPIRKIYNGLQKFCTLQYCVFVVLAFSFLSGPLHTHTCVSYCHHPLLVLVTQVTIQRNCLKQALSIGVVLWNWMKCSRYDSLVN